MFTSNEHIPVLMDEVIGAFSYFDSMQAATLLDATFGGGGHTSALLRAYPKLSITALDRDLDALKLGEQLLPEFEGRLSLKHLNFSEAGTLDERFDGMLADFGISSNQLDTPERGFSFRSDEVLDMRLDQSQGANAGDVLNSYDRGKLARVFKKGGAEFRAGILADEVIKNRPLSTTAQFDKICRDVLGNAQDSPSTLPFQAVRIEVNQELSSINSLLEQTESLLRPSAKFCAISFHSLEDKLVARQFRKLSRVDAPRGLPVRDLKAVGELITPKAIRPSEEEIQVNPRARSAKLRVFKMASH